MADIELVIKIPEDMHKNALNDFLCGSETLVNAIKNGTPLPKGHGRLFDEKDIVRGEYEVIASRIYELDPIIEADKADMRGEQ